MLDKATQRPNEKTPNNEEMKTKIDKIGNYSYSHEIVWKNAIGYLILHVVALYDLIYINIREYKFATLLYGEYILNKMTIQKIRQKPPISGEDVTKGYFLTRDKIGTDYSYKHEIVWKNAIGFLILHVIAIYAIIHLFIGEYQFATLIWAMTYLYMGSEGITIGAHRYWTHRTFKAKRPLQILLLLLQTASGQNCTFIWARDHRLHHRYSDTDADPHNAKRGFFFSHIGWLMTKKHPYVVELGRNVDMNDLLSDSMVMFQKKYYYYFYFVMAFLIPVSIPVYFWNENWTAAILLGYFFRYVLQLNGTWLVNSAAHLWGTRPYDKNLQPLESWFVSFLSMGEGWHNYHHAFPWDYKAAELSMHFNFSATLIRFFESIGQAYDLKTASQEMVERRIKRTGDGTHFKLGDEKARSLMTVVRGPFHPLNPFYTTKMKDPEVELKPEGLPLFHEKDILKI